MVISTDADATCGAGVHEELCPFCGCDPFHRSEMGEPLAAVCCDMGVELYRRISPDEVIVPFDDFRKIASRLSSRAELHAALEAAREHLEYCGYGDRYERECAQQSKLADQIEKALSR